MHGYLCYWGLMKTDHARVGLGIADSFPIDDSRQSTRFLEVEQIVNYIYSANFQYVNQVRYALPKGGDSWGGLIYRP